MSSSHLLIFTAKDTPRINYTFSLFFESLLNTPYKLTTSAEEYKEYSGAKLNYSEQPIEQNEIFIRPAKLLYETGICTQNTTVSEWQKLKIFYQTEGGALPFDIFSAVFYLVSRYEEYLSSSSDEHKRFKATDSLAFKNHFLDIPLVNLWADELKKIILKKYPHLTFNEQKYSFVPTIDVDVAYAHKGRTLGVTLGSCLKALVKFNVASIAAKTATLLGSRQDDYDTYDYQQAVFEKYKVKPIYFFLAGKRGSYDKNITTNSKVFCELVKKISAYSDVGIHPSYHSASKQGLVAAEINRLEINLPKKITKSRQHFLKIALPDTYRCLAALGITDDYSMAYAACPGFRASICTPFFFYDLLNEEILPVKLHSTAVMDGTMNEYLSILQEEAIALTKKLIERVKYSKGEFVCIWHNDTLNDKGKWKGWRSVFEAMLEEAV